MDTFHNAIVPVMSFVRLFGAMPLSGVMTRDSTRVKFRWLSPSAIVTFSFFLCGTFVGTSVIMKHSRKGLTLRKMDQPTYLFSVLVTSILFLYIATKWPKLIQYWTEVDMVFLKPPYAAPKTPLSTKVRAVMIVGVSLRCAEALIHSSSHAYIYLNLSSICNHTYPESVKDYLLTYVEATYLASFKFLGYNFFSVVILMWFAILCFFYWSLPDIFVVMVSFGISTRFEQLNARVQQLEGLNISEKIWREIRIDYIRICELLEAVDECVSPITLLMCANNLFFICTQFLKAFAPKKLAITVFTFWYSLFYLLIRTLVSFLCAATIKDQSKVALQTLHQVPSESWCTEIERLIWQINVENVALSGMKFFYITRKLLFAMVGTIVTYELVLLQIDEPNRKEVIFEFCVKL